MQKATPDQIQQSMEMATTLKVAGIRFVPIPVMNEDEYLLYRNLLEARLEKMEVEI